MSFRLVGSIPPSAIIVMRLGVSDRWVLPRQSGRLSKSLCGVESAMWRRTPTVRASRRNTRVAGSTPAVSVKGP